jgi:hypothetical protein
MAVYPSSNITYQGDKVQSKLHTDAGFCQVLCTFPFKTKFPCFHIYNTGSFAANGQTINSNKGWKCSMHTGWCMHSVGNPRARGLAWRPKRKRELHGWDTSAGPFGQISKLSGSIKGKNVLCQLILISAFQEWFCSVKCENHRTQLMSANNTSQTSLTDYRTTVLGPFIESLHEYFPHSRGTR